MLELGNLAACISKCGIKWEHGDGAALGRSMGALMGKTGHWEEAWGIGSRHGGGSCLYISCYFLHSFLFPSLVNILFILIQRLLCHEIYSLGMVGQALVEGFSGLSFSELVTTQLSQQEEPQDIYINQGKELLVRSLYMQEQLHQSLLTGEQVERFVQLQHTHATEIQQMFGP